MYSQLKILEAIGSGGIMCKFFKIKVIEVFFVCSPNKSVFCLLSQ